VAGWSHALIAPKLEFLKAVSIVGDDHRVALVVTLTILISHTYLPPNQPTIPLAFLSIQCQRLQPPDLTCSVAHGNKWAKHATNLFIYGFLAFHIYNKHNTLMNTLAFVGLVADMAYNQFVIKDLEQELGTGAGGPWFLSLSFIVFFGVSKAFLP
jgi:hypothetical protein